MSKFFCSQSEIVTREEEVQADNRQEAAHAFHASMGHIPDTVDNLETGDIHTVIGLCEFCPTFVFEGDKEYGTDEDGIVWCAQCFKDAPAAQDDAPSEPVDEVAG